MYKSGHTRVRRQFRKMGCFNETCRFAGGGKYSVLGTRSGSDHRCDATEKKGAVVVVVVSGAAYLFLSRFYVLFLVVLVSVPFLYL